MPEKRFIHQTPKATKLQILGIKFTFEDSRKASMLENTAVRVMGIDSKGPRGIQPQPQMSQTGSNPLTTRLQDLQA